MSTKASEGAGPLRAMIILGAYVLVSLAVVNLALKGLLGGGALLEQAGYQAPKQRREALSRWHGALALTGGRPSEAEAADVRSPRLHAVFLGLSSLRDGVDLPAFDQAVQAAEGHAPPLPSLSLSGSGGSFERLEYSVAPVLQDPALRARYVLIMAHPIWWAGWDPHFTPEGSLSLALKEATRGRLSLLKQHAKGIWLINQRLTLAQGLDAALTRARRAALTTLGAPLELIYPPREDPWSRAPMVRAHERAPEAALKAQWASWTRMGKWRAERYASQISRQRAALKRLITYARRAAERVVVVRMPESAALRRGVPPAARELLSASALHHALGAPVEMWDLSALLDDARFFDHAHPNARGRATLTQALAERCR